MKALLSVYDKTGIVALAKTLHEAGIELVSTGTTAQVIGKEHIPVQQVSDLTGSPEMLDGRVKTLHPKVHGGILGRRDMPSHVKQMKEHGIEPIDVVVVNLYPFVETVSKALSFDETIEQVDIGGPAMIRAAAKNHAFVAAVVDPEDYGWVATKLSSKEGLTQDERRKLAAKAFRHVATYDSAVAQWLSDGVEPSPLVDELPLGFRKVFNLRYGENPHQQAALYAPALGASGLTQAAQHQGRDLSFNNLLDADAAFKVVQDFSEATVVVIKHTNPCGLAMHPDVAEAYRRAYAGDPVSAFGGIVGFNRRVTAEVARAMEGVFYEVVVAPGYDDEALDILKKKRNLRVLEVPGGAWGTIELRPITGGMLVQTPDISHDDPVSWKTATKRAPTPDELRDLGFAWRASKHVKSNAIVLAKDGTLIGMGAGQPNRVTSVHLATRVSGDKARGTVLASDAFFPFPDGVDLAGEAGVTAIVQPGGSIRDKDVIAAAEKYNIAMVFTGIRHFRH